MAPQAPQVDKLEKVGSEGFALLDEVYGRNKKSSGSRGPTATTTQANHHHYYCYNYNNRQQYVYRSPQAFTVREPVIDSDQAAQFYGGISIVDYSMRKPIRRVY